MQNRTNPSEPSFPMSRKGLLLLSLSILLIIAGYVLMAGEGSNTNHFSTAIFSMCRTFVAPLLCLLGYLLVIVGIVLLPSGDRDEKVC